MNRYLDEMYFYFNENILLIEMQYTVWISMQQN